MSSAIIGNGTPKKTGLVICVDIQHIGKKSKPRVRGAYAFERTEVFFTEAYGRRVAEILEEAGHTVHLSIEDLEDGILDGSYGKRHEYANSVGSDLYLACHVNAGGADYSLNEVQYNAWERTLWLARTIAENFRDRIPTKKAVIRKLGPGDRGYSCIDGVRKGSAILLEPFFIDDKTDHEFASTDEGIDTIARCITEPIALWVEKYPELIRELEV